MKEGPNWSAIRLKMAENYVDSLLKSGRIIFLLGEWTLIDSAKNEVTESVEPDYHPGSYGGS